MKVHDWTGLTASTENLGDNDIAEPSLATEGSGPQPPAQRPRGRPPGRKQEHQAAHFLMTVRAVSLHEHYRQSMGRNSALQAVLRDLRAEFPLAQFPGCRISRSGIVAILARWQPEAMECGFVVSQSGTGGAIRFDARPTFRKRGQQISRPKPTLKKGR